METGKLIKYGIGLVGIIFLFSIFSSVISTSNEEVGLRNQFKQKMDDLNFRNNRQRQIIDDLQKTKQELMDELNSKDDKA